MIRNQLAHRINQPLKLASYNRTPRRSYGAMSGVPLHYYVIAANSLFYMAWHSRLFSHELLMKHFFTNRYNMVQKRYYTLYTSAFAHNNIIHLLANCAGLYMLSGPLESTFGSTVFWQLHVLGGLGGGLYWYITNGYKSGQSSIGASSAICAHLAFFIMNFPNAMFYIFPIPMPIPGWLLGIGFVGYSYAQSNNRHTIISHAGHLGGFMAGLLYYYLWKNHVV